MPKFLITAPDGRKLRISGDRTPTEDELKDIFSKIDSNEEKVPEVKTAEYVQEETKPQNLVDRISGISKEDIFKRVADATKSPQMEEMKKVMNNFLDPSQRVKDPLGIKTAFSALEGGRSLAQERIKDIASPITSRIREGLSDDPVVGGKESIDSFNPIAIGKTLGINLLTTVSEKEAFDLFEDIVTDPLVYVGGRGGGKALQKIEEKGLAKMKQSKKPIDVALLAGRRAKLSDKIEKFEKVMNDLTTQILRPSPKDIAKAKISSKKVPAVKEAMNIIKKSKTYDDLVQNLDDQIAKNFERRDLLIRKKNIPIGSRYIDDAENLVNELAKPGNRTSPADLKIMRSVLADERNFIKSKGGKISRVEAQQRKETLQESTQILLKKREMGTLTGRESVKMKVDDAIRAGLKDAVAGGDKEIMQLNATFKGLNKARELAAVRSAKDDITVSADVIRELSSSVLESFAFSLKFSLARLLGRQMQAKFPLKTATKRIENLRGRVNKLQLALNRLS